MARKKLTKQQKQMKSKQNALTFERLREILDYSPLNGVFTWRVSRGVFKVGDVAGTIRRTAFPNGRVEERRVIRIDGKNYLASRLAWFWVTGEMPTLTIDHISRDSLDDNYGNLRLATRREQNRNQRNPAGIHGSLSGAHWNPRRNTYQAKVKVDNRTIYLGQFSVSKFATKEHAEQVASAASDFVRRKRFGASFCEPAPERRHSLSDHEVSFLGAVADARFEDAMKTPEDLQHEAEAEDRLDYWVQWGDDKPPETP